MKIATPKQMADLESQACRNGCTECDFMENAGRSIATFILNSLDPKSALPTIYLLCGKGNNAGDAYTAGVFLLESKIQVIAYQIASLNELSPLCKKNFERFQQHGGKIINITDTQQLKFIQPGIIVDGIFGTGFHGTAKEPYASAIYSANLSGLPIYAIDIPSGLNGATGAADGNVIQATHTLFLGLPKKGFFLQEGWNQVGKLHFIPFGLPESYVTPLDGDMEMLSDSFTKSLVPKIVNNRHKYQAGYVVGLAGSPGMPGAALLASISALRAGSGIVKLLHPEGMQTELSHSPYEIIKIPYKTHQIEPILDIMNKASAIFIGPGIGLSQTIRQLLKQILNKIQTPCVLDADALTLIAEEKMTIPPRAILTPHAGEMIRLLKFSTPKPQTTEFLQVCQKFVEEHQITLVLKGGPTFIFHPHETILVNPKGDPGMATAGSGDVLTGIIASLLSQKLPPRDAAALGTYLHGTAGECAAEEKTSYSMIASDLINHLGNAYKKQTRP